MEPPVSERTSHILRVSDLPNRTATKFDLAFDEAWLAELVDELNISAVKKLRFSGSIQARGKRDWHLTAELGATVVQPCVVSLEPVTTRIDETVQRTYLSEMPKADGAEVEMHEDETIDEIPDEIDLRDLLVEALSLSLPQFPRKDGVELGAAVFTEPGKEAMTDEAAKPFAGLSALKENMAKKLN